MHIQKDYVLCCSTDANNFEGNGLSQFFGRFLLFSGKAVLWRDRSALWKQEVQVTHAGGPVG